MAKNVTPIELSALEAFAQQHGRAWKAKLRGFWMSPSGLTGPFTQTLLGLRDSWGPVGLEKYKRPELSAADRVALPQPIPENIFFDVQWIVIVDLSIRFDMREEKHRLRLANIASDRCEHLGMIL